MTRQPAALKRLTVAWPMPRLAPVSTSVLGSLSMEARRGRAQCAMRTGICARSSIALVMPPKMRWRRRLWV